jgi:hypothetical protein
MTATDREGKRLSELHAPRRNRYFYGELLNAADLSMEQQYWLARERQLNRHVLGHGVVSGLGVTVVQNGEPGGLRIRPGLAIDGWGRVITVPEDHDLMPIVLTDECGDPTGSPDDALPARLVVSLCYRECPTDLVRALAPEPPSEGAQPPEATTWVETYAIQVREGSGEDVSVPCHDEVLNALKSGKLRDAVCALTDGANAPPPQDPCVVLANVSVADDGTLDVEQCPPRPIVPTNQLLLALIACLAERIEER